MMKNYGNMHVSANRNSHIKIVKSKKDLTELFPKFYCFLASIQCFLAIAHSLVKIALSSLHRDSLSVVLRTSTLQ